MMERIDAYFESAIEGTSNAQDFDGADMKVFVWKHVVIIGGVITALALMVSNFS